MAENGEHLIPVREEAGSQQSSATSLARSVLDANAEVLDSSGSQRPASMPILGEPLDQLEFPGLQTSRTDAWIPAGESRLEARVSHSLPTVAAAKPHSHIARAASDLGNTRTTPAEAASTLPEVPILPREAPSSAAAEPLPPSQDAAVSSGTARSVTVESEAAAAPAETEVEAETAAETPAGAAAAAAQTTTEEAATAAPKPTKSVAILEPAAMAEAATRASRPAKEGGGKSPRRAKSDTAAAVLLSGNGRVKVRVHHLFTQSLPNMRPSPGGQSRSLSPSFPEVAEQLESDDQQLLGGHDAASEVTSGMQSRLVLDSIGRDPGPTADGGRTGTRRRILSGLWRLFGACAGRSQH